LDGAASFWRRPRARSRLLLAPAATRCCARPWAASGSAALQACLRVAAGERLRARSLLAIWLEAVSRPVPPAHQPWTLRPLTSWDASASRAPTSSRSFRASTTAASTSGPRWAAGSRRQPPGLSPVRFSLRARTDLAAQPCAPHSLLRCCSHPACPWAASHANGAARLRDTGVAALRSAACAMTKRATATSSRQLHPLRTRLLPRSPWRTLPLLRQP
jgi:hypothetical protein